MVTQSEKREKSLAEFIVIIALVGILMSIFIHYFIKQETHFSDAGFKRIAQSFTTKVSAIHAQWLMDKQPSVIRLVTSNNEKQLVSVNGKGWVDVDKSLLVCDEIWQLVMETPLDLMKQTISAIEVRNYTLKPNEGVKKLCRYVLPNGRYFDYNRLNGRVSMVESSQGAK